MINKLIYINKSLNKLFLSIKTFDIYFIDTFKKNLNKYKNSDKIISYYTSYNYKYIVNLYEIYNCLCLNEFQYISLMILRKNFNHLESNINLKYETRFQYLSDQYLIHNIYRQNQKNNNIPNIKLVIIYVYILNQIQNSYGFYILIQYLLII
uniref:Uncharacterized protein n=1 Tax=Hypnea pannosa TaxID=105607 RepID=A0A4D6WX89_9FLOR|nr:hypothetical protein [Hypnea pannosa]